MVAPSVNPAPKPGGPRTARKARLKTRPKRGTKTGANLGAKSASNSAKRTCSGAEIRAKIAANRAKRLAIAGAMKREAGVTGHEINKENLGGLAYIGTGRILSPEGRKIVQLYTLAHECGHIFLHNSGEGYWLPGHIKELEAESYAHQAFREHGMTLPRRLSDWGRTYVGSWVAQDRAAGIPIDPRAEAYAAGRRSPYEPLRMVPATWTMFRGEKASAPAVPASAPAMCVTRSWLGGLLDRAHRWLSGSSAMRRLADEAGVVMRLMGLGMLYGTAGCAIAMDELQNLYPDIYLKVPGYYTVTGLQFGMALLGGLLLGNLLVLCRAMTR